LDSSESGDQHVEDFEAYRRHERPFYLSRAGGRFDRRRRDGNLSVLSQWASEYDPNNGMKVNYQVLGSGAGIEQETTKISERQSDVVA
jgi:hypothetical protein